jgi:orotidine-5'-phosphate decarboxylase
MKKSPADYLALALDNLTSTDALRRLIEETAPSIGVFKIGLEQFTRFGPPLLDLVRDAGRKIFLDLKFHDIPNTVGKAVEAAAGLGVDYLTIHVAGGSAMMRAAHEAAIKGLKETSTAPKIIGVTLLTSIDALSLNRELSVPLPIEEYLRGCVARAKEAQLDGVVCSAADLGVVKPLLPDTFEIITPGIRLAGADSHDQKRVSTPAAAISGGATLLVLGRAVTGAGEPGVVAEKILKEIEKLINSTASGGETI